MAEAVRDRLAAPAQAHPDAQAITLRQTLAGLTAAQSATVRAVLGRIDASQGLPLIVWGPSAQVLAADRFGYACAWALLIVPVVVTAVPLLRGREHRGAA